MHIEDNRVRDEFSVQRIPVCLVFVADAPWHGRKTNAKHVFLSFTDNVPFGDTLRAESYSYFSCNYYTPLLYKTQAFARICTHIFFAIPQTYRMGLIFIRTVIIFIATLIVMRLMGKRQIGEMQPYELVITLIIADLACIPMADTSIPLLYGIIAILSVYFLHQIICFLDLHFPAAKAVVSGVPSIVLNKNGIDDTQLKKNNLDVSDLIESLRVEGYFSLDAVDYALYEAEGTFSALPKPNYQTLQNSLPLLLIDEGKFDNKNLAYTKREKEYFLEFLRRQGCDELKKILVMTVDGNGKVYLQKKGEKYKVLDLKWEEQLW